MHCESTMSVIITMAALVLTTARLLFMVLYHNCHIVATITCLFNLIVVIVTTMYTMCHMLISNT